MKILQSCKISPNLVTLVIYDVIFPSLGFEPRVALNKIVLDHSAIQSPPEGGTLVNEIRKQQIEHRAKFEKLLVHCDQIVK